MSTILFTGFPGFLGSELVARVLARGDEHVVVCLVQPKFAALARQRVAELVEQWKFAPERLCLAEGDITAPRLGLANASTLQREVAEIFHLAAVYDLSVPRDLALRVNAVGTHNVLDFAAGAPGLARLHYVSTCYVSGRYPGTFKEADLEKGQTFNNFYEETKHIAEVHVRQHMADGLPATIYRPSVVVGDSKTGATQKYDGPYYVMQWLMRQPRLAVLPTVGDTRRFALNVVPRDFVIDAIDYLSAIPSSAGVTYQLADPAPPRVTDLIRILADVTQRRVLRIPLPLAVAKAALAHGPGVYRLMRIPPTAIDYFVHPTEYDTTNATRDLAPSGIRAPRVAEYAPVLAQFMREHPDIGAHAMA